jgi:hypothetical protein
MSFPLLPLSKFAVVAVPVVCWVAHLLWTPPADISPQPPLLFCCHRHSMLITCGRHAFISHAGHHAHQAQEYSAMHAHTGKQNYSHDEHMPNLDSRPELFTSTSLLPPIFDTLDHIHLFNQFAFFSFNFSTSPSVLIHTTAD